jgi:hypothetical protein
MNTNTVWWIGFCAAAMLVVSHRPAAGEPWRAAEQPELTKALEQAPVLQTESLGEPSRGVLTFTYALVPNHDGKTWDFLQWYFKEYRGPTWLYAIDLGTGQVKKQRCADNRQFYLSGRALGFDGKFYMVQPGPTGRGSDYGMFMEVYDPVTNTLDDRGEIVPGLSGEVRPIVVGPDGRLYGTGSYEDGKVGLYIYDPKLRKVVKNFGGVGPSHANGAWSRYDMGVDDTHAYIASGMIPWYLVAVNLETGEDKVLLESPPGSTMDIVNSFPGVWAIVPQSDGSPNREYWLYHGQAIPKVNDTPPWPKQDSPWDKAPPKPEIYRDQLDPDAKGNATFWYRLPEDAAKAPEKPPADAKAEDLGWRAVRLEDVDSYPHRIAPLALLPDGRLYGEGDYYCGSFLFDPRTDQATPLGRNQGLASYARIAYGDKLYLSGYPGGPLFAYEPTRPWTLHKGGPPGHPAPDAADPASNPRRLGAFESITRVAIAHRSAIGADGRIYFGGFGERGYTGGGFGWYDPNTEKLGGFWKPLSGYGVHWLAPLQGGRLIVMSTVTTQDELNENRVPEEAKLFVYDVNQGQIVREIVPVSKAPGTGLILNVAPNRLLGLTVDPEHTDASLLYGVDVATGEVLFRKALPRPVSAEGRWYGHWVDPSYEDLDLVRGPDVFVWTYLKDVLVRIDPKDASVHVVGKIEPLGRPTFVGRDIYLSGPEQLRRIRNIVPAP